MMSTNHSMGHKQHRNLFTNNQKLQLCTADVSKHYSASHGLLVAGACVGHAWAQLTRAMLLDQAEVVVGKCDGVAAGVDGMAGVVAADSVAGHDVEALIHAHPDLPPSAEACSDADEMRMGRHLALADAAWPQVMMPAHGASTAPRSDTTGRPSLSCTAGAAARRRRTSAQRR